MTGPGDAPLRLEEVIELVRAAGSLALLRQPHATPQRKADHSMVTDADVEAQQLLLGGLRELTPDVEVIAEEGVHRTSTVPEWAWAVDPIDGTHSYILGYPTWGVSVGLMHHGRPAAGVLHFPALRAGEGEMYHVGLEGPPVGPDGPLEPDPAGTPEMERILFLSSNAHRRFRLDWPGKTRSLGSTALHLAHIAAGRAAGQLVVARIWDLVAGVAMLERVGGSLRPLLVDTDLDLGAMLDGRRTPGPLVAAGPGMDAAVREAVREFHPPSFWKGPTEVDLSR